MRPMRTVHAVKGGFKENIPQDRPKQSTGVQQDREDT